MSCFVLILGLVLTAPTFTCGPSRAAQEAKRKTAWMMTKEYTNVWAEWVENSCDTECPEKLDDLSKYMNKKDSKDPWGSQFVMKCGDSALDVNDGSGFGVLSLGPDKQDGTDDDIKSWESMKK